MEEFDLIVVGSGAGLSVASAAVDRGQDVAVVEDGPLGGTCLNRGCIPSKMLIHRADVMETIRTADRFGIDASVETVDFAGSVHEVNEAVSEDASGIERGLEQSDHHTLYHTEGRFVDDRTLAVDDEEITAETVVVAAGCRPDIPPIDGIDAVDYLTSTDALRLERRPESLIVIGGGYIAAELGHYFGAFGTDVTVVGRHERLLPDEDEQVQETFTEVFGRRHEVLTGYEATAVAERGDSVAVTAVGPDGSETKRVADELLVAAGITPNTDRLAVGNTGVETDDEGYVVADDTLRTTAEGVWALGDILGRYQFRHAANHEARTVARNLLLDGPDEAVDYTAMPHAVFASPQVAGAGETEQALRDANRDYAVRTYDYADTAMGDALKETDGFVKVLVEPDDRTILGCHVLGPEASTLLHEVLPVMRAGGTVADITDTIHVHPALSEVVHRAFAGQFRRPGAGHAHHHDHGE
jgi:dihydrolipoamide dehydrogenase